MAVRFLIHGCDATFSAAFDTVLATENVEIIRIPVPAPLLIQPGFLLEGAMEPAQAPSVIRRRKNRATADRYNALDGYDKKEIGFLGRMTEGARTVGLWM